MTFCKVETNWKRSMFPAHKELGEHGLWEWDWKISVMVAATNKIYFQQAWEFLSVSKELTLKNSFVKKTRVPVLLFWFKWSKGY